jgi:hypothetical protein
MDHPEEQYGRYEHPDAGAGVERRSLSQKRLIRNGFA